jgi:germacradienol/geosmin synthase
MPSVSGRVSFDMPDFYIGWPARLNPHGQTARTHSKAWAQQVGILDTAACDRVSQIWSEARHDSMDFALLAAYTHPDTSCDELCLMSDWITWAFYFDDYFLDVYKGRRDLAGGRAYLDRLSLFMPMRPADSPPEATAPVERGLLDLWWRTVPSRSLAWRKQLLEITTGFLRESEWELENMTETRVSNPIEYVEMRRRAGGALWAAQLVEHASFVEVPERIYDLRPLRVLRDTFADAVHLRNDIFSYDREIREERELANGVFVLERFFGIDTQRAVNIVNDLLSSRLHQFEHTAVTELPILFEELGVTPSERADVMRYIGGLQDWQAGAHEWHLRSSRYANTVTRPDARAVDGLTGLGTERARSVGWSPESWGSTRLRSFTHVPFSAVGPTRLPDFRMPYVARVNPHLEHARADVIDWFGSMGLFDAVPGLPEGALWTEEMLAEFDFGQCSARIHPDASATELAVTTRWLAWGTYCDDWFQRLYGQRRDLVGGRVCRERLEGCMPLDGISMPPPLNPMERALGDLWQLTTAPMTLDVRRPFRAGISRMTDSWMWELKNRAQGRIPDPVDYVEMRRLTFGSDYTLNLARITHGGNLPREFFDTRPMRRLEHAANDYAALMNDVFSYQMEIEFDGDIHNGVLVVQNFLAVSPDDAARIVCDLMNARIEQFEQIVATKLEPLADSFDLSLDDRATLAGWVAMLQDWMAGIYVFHMMTARYSEALLVRSAARQGAATRVPGSGHVPSGPTGLGSSAGLLYRAAAARAPRVPVAAPAAGSPLPASLETRRVDSLARLTRRRTEARATAATPSAVSPTQAPGHPPPRPHDHSDRRETELAPEPFTLPEFYEPSPARLNPALETTRAHSRQWAYEMGILSRSAEVGESVLWNEALLDAMDYGLLSALGHPDAPPSTLDVVTEWYVCIFYIDDHFVEVYKRGRRDADDAAAYLARLSGFMPLDPDVGIPDAKNAVERAISDLWARTAVDRSRAWRERFALSTMNMLESFVWELANLNSARVPNPIEYIAMRRHTGGAQWSADLVEFALGVEIPATIVATRPMRVLNECFADVSHLRNDIFSYQREIQQEGETSNGVFVIERFLDCSTQEAADRVSELASSRMYQFENTTVTELPALFTRHQLDPQQRVNAMAYVRGLEDWQAGAHEWHKRSSRYMNSTITDDDHSILGPSRIVARPRVLTPASTGVTRGRSHTYGGYREVGPTLLPVFHMPCVARVNPDLERARAACADWCRRIGMTDPPAQSGCPSWTAPLLAGFDFGYFAASVFPTAPGHELDSRACWIAWRTYAHDHFSGTYNSAVDVAGATLLRERLSEFMPLDRGAVPVARNPVEAGLADLWLGTARLLDPADTQALRDSVEVMLDAWLWEGHNHIEHRMPDPIDYLEMRRSTFGTQLLSCLSCVSDIARLPTDLLVTRTWLELESAARDYACLTNDVFSYQKEVEYDGEFHNFVLLTQNFLDIDRERAVVCANDLMTSRIRQLEHILATDLAPLAEDYMLDAAAQSTLAARTAFLQDLVAGTLSWHQRTSRYDERPVRAGDEARAGGGRVTQRCVGGASRPIAGESESPRARHRLDRLLGAPHGLGTAAATRWRSSPTAHDPAPRRCRPEGFPATIAAERTSFENRSGDVAVDNLWVCHPASPADVVAVANWARAQGWRLRPCGRGQAFSPVVVAPHDGDRTMLVDTTRHLTAVRVDHGMPASVTAQTGVTLDVLLGILRVAGLAVAVPPGSGDVTLGGVLAVGAHGTGLPTAGEPPIAGYGYGSMSGLVISLTAIVWDPEDGTYRLKRFTRTDSECGALLVHLGRAFITEATLCVAPDLPLRCESRCDIPARDVFAPPDLATSGSFAAHLERCGRVDAIWLPFTAAPWMKFWTREPECPRHSKPVPGPYNYPFTDGITKQTSDLFGQLIAGAGDLTPAICNAEMAMIEAGLLATASSDIWGPSMNVLLYLRPTALRMTTSGYAVVTRSGSIQRVVSAFYAYLSKAIDDCRARGDYPVNGMVNFRVTALDDTGTNPAPRAVEPQLSPVRPRQDRPEWDVAVWVDVMTVRGTPGATAFFRETELWALNTFTSGFAALRPEWSNGWAYTDGGGACTDEAMLSTTIPDAFRAGQREGDDWDAAVATLDALDPHGVFTNAFLDRLLGPAPRSVSQAK